jgi:cyclopropane fatty-acyl-phospholipid synthase-like methyltransferase
MDRSNPGKGRQALQYWEQRYQTGDMPWEKGAPSPGLVDFLAAHRGLPGETVCIPGCGTGHDAREWARAGFRVYGYDLAPTAVCLSDKRTREAGLRVEFRQADFLRDQPPFRFDWIFEHTLFCAILPEERDLYLRAVCRWLKPGGRYLAVNYLISDTDGPPYGVTDSELRRRFSPHLILQSDWAPRSYPNRAGLERCYHWRMKGGRETPPPAS